MKLKIFTAIAGLALLFGACDEVLDRPSPTVAEDESYWTSAEKVRLYSNGFYLHYFEGYGTGWTHSSAPLLDYTFSDDIVNYSTQSQFTRAVPTSTGWDGNYKWIRRANVMIDRIDSRMTDILSAEEYSHWMGIARLFRGLEYARLVNSYGDVPYYDHVVKNTDKNDLYKDRTPRNEVMDNVYDDFEYALANIRLNDGAQNINRYVAAALVSRWALYEGSWQKYYYNNPSQATKFFNLAVAAGDIVMNSGRFDITLDFRSLFGSKDLTSSKDVILYRKYDAAQGVTHCVASYSNVKESRTVGPNLSLVKSFVCVDGKDWQTSSVENPKDFSIANLIKTRDSRFEASFYHKPTATAKSSYLYPVKFIARSALKYLETPGGAPDVEYTSANNLNGYPVLRYAEVLLNWIEAKAELSTLGAGSVTQADIDLSVNKIRNRPLAQEAIERGVQKTASMDLAALPDDPSRDSDVPALLWEIRRERRMEFAFEHSRIIDLRRWKKLEYMDTDANADLLSGTWVNFPAECPDDLVADNKGKIRVMTASGDLITFDGKNGAKMVGFFYPAENKGRLPFLNVPNINPYLTPVGSNTITDYANKGYKLTQTEGWPESSN